MTKAPRNRSSVLVFAGLLALVVVPVVLVSGPLRDTFFPARAEAASALARLTPPAFQEFGLENTVLASDWVARLAALYESSDYPGVTLELESHSGLATPDGLALLDAVCLLQQRRPGPALIRLQPLAKPPHHRAARWFAAQCHLILGQLETARKELTMLQQSPGAYQQRALAQLDQVLALIHGEGS